MSLRAPLVCAVAVGALALTGCGRGTDETATRTVTQRFLDALSHHDGALACAQLSSATQSEVESQEHRRCPIAILNLNLNTARILRVAVYLTSAKVDLADGESVFLDQSSQGWELSAVGCKPQGGKPTNEPYDCDLKA